MAFASLKSLAYNDEDHFEHLRKMTNGPELPEYPPGLCFSVPLSDLEAVGAEDGDPDDTMRFSAMGEVTNVFKGREDCRIELRLTEFAGEDGKFCELSVPPCICLCGPELEKMELEADCERGDTIHLIGTVRLESVSDSEYGGEMACLQITELTCEDESTEARED
jgi:hypothetical protein